MSDADREWTIEHTGEQPYDILSVLDHDETSVTIRGPNERDRPGNRRTREWRKTFQTLGAGSDFGRLSRQRAWCLSVCGD